MAREIKRRHYVTCRWNGEDRHALVTHVHDQDTVDLSVYVKVKNEDDLHIMNAIEGGMSKCKRAKSKAEEAVDGSWWDGAEITDLTPAGVKK